MYFDADARIRKIDTLGIVTTIAGTGIYGHSGDGGPAISAMIGTAGFHSALTIDNAGNIYYAEYSAPGYPGYAVRKISPVGIITTYAGGHGSGNSGDNGPADSAQLMGAFGVATDGVNLYIADDYFIRKVNPAGIITTIAGVGTNAETGNGGPALLAGMRALEITVDPMKNIYFNEGSVVRKINTSGIISRFAGGYNGPYSGDEGPADSAAFGGGMTGMTVDPTGNLYVGSENYYTVRVVDTNGIIHRFAGSGSGTPVYGFSGDGCLSTCALLDYMGGIASDNHGNIYIADGVGNRRIRKVTPGNCVCPTGIVEVNNIDEIGIYPNPADGNLHVQYLNEGEKPASINIFDLTGKLMLSKDCTDFNGDMDIDVSEIPQGMYFVKVGNKAKKFVKE